MQAQGSNPASNHQQQLTDPSPFKDAHEQAQLAQKKMAKKTGKVDSLPADPKKFFDDYEKTTQLNKEIDWLNSDEVHYKEPARNNVIKPTGQSVVSIPPFLNNKEQVQNNSNSSKEQPKGTILKFQRSADDDFSLVVDGVDPVKAHQDELSKLSPAEKLSRARNKMGANQAKVETASNNTKQKQKEVIDLAQPPSPSNPNFKQSDPFVNINTQPKYNSTDPRLSPPKGNQFQNSANSNQQNLNQRSPPTFNNPPSQASIPSNQQQPNQITSTFKGSSANTPIVVGSSPQNKAQLGSQNNTRNAIFNNNRANIQNNTSSNVLNNNQVGFNKTNLNSNNLPGVVSHTNNSNTIQGNNSNVNNPFIQQTVQNNFRQSSFSSNANQTPNLQMSQNLPNIIQSGFKSIEGNWISQFSIDPNWHQHRAQIYERMKNRLKLNDEILDILAAMTFQSRSTISINQIDKFAEEIITLGVNYEDMKDHQSQLLFQNKYDSSCSKQDHEQIGFGLKYFLSQFNDYLPSDFNSYDESEIQDLAKDKQVMSYYERIKDRSVAQFLQQYYTFQQNSSKEIKKIAQSTIQVFKKKRQIQQRIAEYEMEERSNKNIRESPALANIQAKQKNIIDLLGKFSLRLNIGQEILPKNELNYELQDLKTLEKEEQNLLAQIHTWRELLQEQQNSQPYKQVIDILCNSTSEVANKVNKIEDELLPAIEQQSSKKR